MISIEKIITKLQEIENKGYDDLTVDCRLYAGAYPSIRFVMRYKSHIVSQNLSIYEISRLQDEVSEEVIDERLEAMLKELLLQ